MKWELDFKNQRPGLDRRMDESIARAWEFMQAIKPYDPTFHRWRETARTKAQAEANPNIETLDQLRQAVYASADPELPGVIRSFFSGDIDADGSSLSIQLGMPSPDTHFISLQTGHTLGARIDTDEDFTDWLIYTGARIINPTIGALTREDYKPRNINIDGPEPYDYVPGWKMFFHRDSPHWPQAHALANKTMPVAEGAILTYGTPDTYTQTLNQWPRPQNPQEGQPS
ncbi:Imm52 family immunity protein [Actinomyces qiguomingii]|uniref:Imm52 family immunity protein n=1 Tax=Actinomyces qiguomingii TaxID=2057800 RepID=UPI000FFE3EA7|nr:Imm52 family immunity protein [Actinomyces qiguomingii]